MQEIILEIRYCERGLSKGLEGVNIIFSFQLIPWKNRKNKKGQKQVTSHSSGYKTSSENSFIGDVLPDSLMM